METKICNKCQLDKPVTEYHKNGDRIYSICKVCKREQRLKSYENEKITRKKYCELNKDKINEQKRKYRKSNVYKQYQINRKTEKKLYNKQYYLKNKEKINIQKRNYIKRKRQTDLLFKIKSSIGNRIYLSITKQGYFKNKRTEKILGCIIKEFKQYLESKFEPWMTWDNYGLYNGTENYGWDIDHIIPHSLAKTEEELLKLNHYSNLQPLCSYINRDIKRNNPNN